jgi:CRISPR-associated protein Cas1
MSRLVSRTKVLKNIIPLIEEVLSAGEILPPGPPIESIPPAIPNAESLGDDGHRSE